MKYETFPIDVSAETIVVLHDILAAALQGKDHVADVPCRELRLIRNTLRARIQHFPMGIEREEDWLG